MGVVFPVSDNRFVGLLENTIKQVMHMRIFSVIIIACSLMFPVWATSAQHKATIWDAALNGDLKSVKKYVNTGTSVNALNPDKSTPLMMASFNGHTALVSWLLGQSATINLEDVDGRTALMYCSSGPFADALELLLKHKAKPNHIDNEEGFTALMFAASEGHFNNVKLLVKYGADITIKDKDGDTASAHASKNRHFDVAEYLSKLETLKNK